MYMSIYIFPYLTFTCTCKHRTHNHQSYIYYDMPGNKKNNNSKKIEL